MFRRDWRARASRQYPEIRGQASVGTVPGAGRPKLQGLCKLPFAQPLQFWSVLRKHWNSFKIPHLGFLICADSVWGFFCRKGRTAKTVRPFQTIAYDSHCSRFCSAFGLVIENPPFRWCYGIISPFVCQARAEDLLWDDRRLLPAFFGSVSRHAGFRREGRRVHSFSPFVSLPDLHFPPPLLLFKAQPSSVPFCCAQKKTGNFVLGVDKRWRMVYNIPR